MKFYGIDSASYWAPNLPALWRYGFAGHATDILGYKLNGFGLPPSGSDLGAGLALQLAQHRHFRGRSDRTLGGVDAEEVKGLCNSVGGLSP